MKKILLSVFFAVAASCNAIAQNSDQMTSMGCGSLAKQPGGYGPHDYREKDKLPIVEKHHFDAGVENLSRGLTAKYPGHDIDYTLRAIPNHHRALMSMVKLGERDKTSKPREATYTVECYLVRAETFRPDDEMVKVIYGYYFLKSGRHTAAVEKLEAAREIGSDNPNVSYNLGLAYFELKEYDKALASAHKAYQMGFQLPGLRNKLEKVGRWRDMPLVKPDEGKPQGTETSSEAVQ